MRLIVAHNLSQLPVFFFSAGLANSPGLCPDTMRLSSLIKISAWAFPQLQHVSPSILLPRVTLNPTIHRSYGELRRAMPGSQHRGCTWPRRERAIAGKASALSANSGKTTEALLQNTQQWEPRPPWSDSRVSLCCAKVQAPAKRADRAWGHERESKILTHPQGLSLAAGHE